MSEKGNLSFKIVNHTKITLYIKFVSGIILEEKISDWFPVLSAHAFLKKPADHGYGISDLKPGEIIVAKFDVRKECTFSTEERTIRVKTERDDDCLILHILFILGTAQGDN